MGNSPEKIDVEVAYALPDEQILLLIQVQKGAEIKEVITQSKILEDYPELELDKLDVGIFGKMVKINQKVRDRDRIEIYRPLIADPKEVRKRRAAEGKRLKKGGATTASAK
ncbi:MAG TPA: RnfH family protein [Leucothrix sp.]|nr:RnfH family protein [Leucothrix sp.]